MVKSKRFLITRTATDKGIPIEESATEDTSPESNALLTDNPSADNPPTDTRSAGLTESAPSDAQSDPSADEASRAAEGESSVAETGAEGEVYSYFLS